MNQDELCRVIEAVLFAAGEPVDVSRLALAAQCGEEEIHEAARALSDELAFARRGVRVLRLEERYQMCSAAEFSAFVTTALETRRPPKLSSSQLETLTIVAYYQPVTRAAIEQIRGVDSAYTVGALQNKKLIEECGRLNVPGRPIQYRTTPDFLRTFGLSTLAELPEIPRVSLGRPAVPEEAPAQADDAQQTIPGMEAAAAAGAPAAGAPAGTAHENAPSADRVSVAHSAHGTDAKPAEAARPGETAEGAEAQK